MDKNTKINEMIITDEYTTADENTTIDEIAKKLQELEKESEHAAVLITKTKEEKKVIGYITDKDMISWVADGKKFQKKKANELMKTDFKEVNEEDTIGNMIPDITEKYPNAIVVTDTDGNCVGYFSKNDYEEALAGLGYYDRTSTPKNKDEWRMRGIALSSQGKKREALKCFSKSMGAKSDSEKSWSELAKRLERLNRLKDAIMCYDKVLTINPKSDEAFANKGDLYSKENTDNLAVHNYKKALDLNPKNVEALTNMGMEQANIGQIEEAMKSIDHAVELKGETAELLYMKGTVLDKAQNYKESLKCYNRATELNAYYEEAWFNKGVVLNKLGKNKEALQCLMKILMINPNNESARETLNMYKQNGALQMY